MDSQSIKWFGMSALVGISGILQAQRTSSNPNIVFILADDLGWKDLGCYGNPNTETPAIDSLAASGLRFTQAYAACPVSSPSRAAILTGKYPARLKLTNYLVGNRTDSASPVLPAPWKPYLEAKETTLAEKLREKGYTTGMVGKWHLGNHDSIAPWGQGFEYTRVIGKKAHDYYNYSIFEDSYQKEVKDNGQEYITDKLTSYGVEFIQQNRNKPFFLYLAYSAPHIYIVPRADKISKYCSKYQNASEKFNPYYAAVVESIDDGVRSIVQALQQNGLLENTIIVFTSDNGGLGMDEGGPTPTSNLPLRKWKGHVYEGGIRVPAIVSWPSKIPAAKISEYYFSGADYFPTFCELTGIRSLPENIDGSSIAEVLKNPENKSLSRGPVFWHYPHFSNQMGRPAGAVRLGDYKLVELYESPKTELYNLGEDISESNDLSAVMPDKVKELKSLLIEWRKEVDAQMPVPKKRSIQ